MEKKHCPTCNQDLHIDDFGICKARRDGRNLYCKSCIRGKVNECRRQTREMKAAQKNVTKIIVERKPQAVAKPEILPEPIFRVKRAISLGARTREEIYTASGLRSWDLVSDALAVLNLDQGSIRMVRVNGEVRFYPVKVA